MFEQFCLNKASKLTLDPTDDMTIPERYQKPVESLITILKNKVDIFDRINVPFVEAAFDNNFEEILNEKLENGEVPDGIIRRLSDGLYHEYPSRLSDTQQAIIKVLSVYICIQN